MMVILLSDALLFIFKNRKIFCCTVMVVMTEDGNNVEMMGATKTQLWWSMMVIMLYCFVMANLKSASFLVYKPPLSFP